MTTEGTLPVGSSESRVAVLLCGFLRANLGLGQHARSYVSALRAARVPVATRSVQPISDQRLPDDRKFEDLLLPDAVEPQVNLLSVNGDQLHDLIEEVDDLDLASRYSIGAWAWETDVVPDHWRAALDVIDEIWVTSTFVARNISRWSPVPVVVMPLAVEKPLTGSTNQLQGAVEEPGFVFLSALDFLSTLQRKNPLGVIEAFKSAFSPGEGPILFLKTRNAERRPSAWEQLLSAAGDRPDVTVMDGNYDTDEMGALLRGADCFVSLHRSEGFGLMLAESMALGKPVIATGFGGNTDFMTPWNSFLVDWTPTSVGTAVEIYPAEGSWAEPSLEHAAALMREVWENQDEARRRGARAAKEVEAQLSAEAVGAIARARLERISARRGGYIEPGPSSELASGGEIEPYLRFDLSGREGRGGRIRRVLRRIVMTAISPYTWAERHLDEAIVAGLDRVEERISALQEAVNQRISASEEALNQRISALEEALHQRISALEKPIAALQEDTARLEEAAQALPWTAGEPFEEFTEPLVGRVVGFRQGLIDSDEPYRSFEEIFRGPAERVEELVRPYVPLLRGHGPVLDVGCGRGELLAVLGDAGIEARGVDLDPGMVRIAHERGLPAVLGDGIEAVEELEPASLGAVTAIHVIEHLPVESLQRLLRGARRALQPGGLLVFETINPHAGPALKTFWIDPTHRHPIFPEVALALCGIAGFQTAFVWHPRGVGDVEADRFREHEYAVVARTPGDEGENEGRAPAGRG